jgi:uncharacterized membrane protein required for colicin V production
MLANLAFTLPLADILIFGTIVLFAFYGFKRGVLRALFGFLQVYFAFIITTLLYERAALLLQAKFDIPSQLAQMICFTVIFAIFLAMIWVLVFTVKKVSKPPETSSSLSRIGGAILGVAQGTLIVSIIIMGISFYSPPIIQSSLENAISYRVIKQVAPGIKDFTVERIPSLKEEADVSESDDL